MKYLLLLFFAFSCHEVVEQSKVETKAIEYAENTVELNYGTYRKKYSLGSKDNFIELGDELKSLRVMEEGEFQIEARILTSLSIMDEGPHWDLLDWKHGESPWFKLKQDESDFVFDVKMEKDKFPEFENSELINYLEEQKVPQRWVELAQKCKDKKTYPCGVSESHYQFRIYKKVDGKFKLYSEFELLPPMGC
jgi:hypothetical protein